MLFQQDDRQIRTSLLHRRFGKAVLQSSVGALAFSMLAAPAFAQKDNTAKVDDNVIIVIGVTKQDANLQDVPSSITAFSGDKLEALSVVNVQDVGAQTPGFLIRQAPSNASAVALGLRGQVQNDVLATVDPSVGTYVDGVYWARAYGLNSDILDVSSVQILKGPQGTLFGRNTSAGALVIQTNNPDPYDFSGSIDARYGRFDERAVTAVLNAPLIEGKLAIRGAFTMNKRDGYVKGYDVTTAGFPLTGETYNNRDILQGRLKVLIKPLEDIEILLSGEVYDSDSKGPGRFLSHFSPALGTNGPAAAAYDLANLDVISVSPSLDGITPGTSNGVSVNLYDDPFVSTKTETYQAKVNFTLNDVTAFQFLNSYRTIKSTSVFDLDGTALFRGNNEFSIDLEQYMSEVQLSGSLFGDQLDYVVGGNYLFEKGLDNSQQTSYPGGVPAAPLQKVSNFRSNINNSAWGLFTQGSFHITDALTLTAGVRHSWDVRKNISDNQVVFDGFAPVAPTSPAFCLVSFSPPRTDGNCFLSAKDTYKAWSYTAGLDYKIADDILIYAKTGKGYRAGAQQLRTVSFATSAASLPEQNFEHEIGLKSQFWDRRVRFNIAGYLNDVKDWQTTKILTTPAGVRYTAVSNPADLRNIGVEADLSIEPVDGLTFSVALALNDEKYKNCAGGVCPELIRDVIQEQINLGVNYEGDLGFAELGLNLNYNWTGKVPLSSDRYEAVDIAASLGLPAAAAGAVAALAVPDAEYDQIFFRKSVGILNARASLTFNDMFEVYVYGRNITDERYIEHSQFLFNLTTSSVRNDPATYGIGAKFKF